MTNVCSGDQSSESFENQMGLRDRCEMGGMRKVNVNRGGDGVVSG